MVGYRLRALETSDIEVLLEWENHPEQWEVSLRNTPYSRTVLEQYITAAAADFWEIGQVRFVLCEAGNDRPLGLVDVFDASPIHKKAEVGILIDSKLRGTGLGSCALKLIQAWARDFAMLDQLYAQVFSENHAALRAFAKADFVEIGRWIRWIKTPKGEQDVTLLQWLR